MNNEKRSGCFRAGPTSTERIIHVGTHGPCVRPVRNSPTPPTFRQRASDFRAGYPAPTGITVPRHSISNRGPSTVSIRWSFHPSKKR